MGLSPDPEKGSGEGRYCSALLWSVCTPLNGKKNHSWSTKENQRLHILNPRATAGSFSLCLGFSTVVFLAAAVTMRSQMHLSLWIIASVCNNTWPGQKAQLLPAKDGGIPVFRAAWASVKPARFGRVWMQNISRAETANLF